MALWLSCTGRIKRGREAQATLVDQSESSAVGGAVSMDTDQAADQVCYTFCKGRRKVLNAESHGPKTACSMLVFQITIPNHATVKSAGLNETLNKTISSMSALTRAN